MRGRRAAIAAFLAALSAPPMVASAGEGDARAYVPPAPVYDWTVTLGAEGREEPLFQGSSRERLRPYPIFAVRRYGTRGDGAVASQHDDPQSFGVQRREQQERKLADELGERHRKRAGSKSA